MALSTNGSDAVNINYESAVFLRPLQPSCHNKWLSPMCYTHTRTHTSRSRRVLSLGLSIVREERLCQQSHRLRFNFCIRASRRNGDLITSWINLLLVFIYANISGTALRHPLDHQFCRCDCRNCLKREIGSATISSTNSSISSVRRQFGKSGALYLPIEYAANSIRRDRNERHRRPSRVIMRGGSTCQNGIVTYFSFMNKSFPPCYTQQILFQHLHIFHRVLSFTVFLVGNIAAIVAVFMRRYSQQ